MQDISEEILCNSKWLIIKEIAQKTQSASELATVLKTSVSNVIQQLKLIEAYGLVRKEKSTEKNIGKPKINYALNQEFVYALMVNQGRAEKKYFKSEGISKMMFNLLFLSSDDAYYIMKFSIKYEEILKKCKAIGYIKSTRESIELFVITDHVDEIRAKFSNLFIEDLNGKTKKIINWSHNDFEINDGLDRGDKYFMDMLKNVQVIHDPGNVLIRYKAKRENI